MHSIDSKRIFVSLFLVAFLVVLVLPAYGQERFGNVTGVVKDQTGAVLPGVAVTITNKDTNRSVTVHSRSDGSYTLADVEPGHYSVTFVKTGFTGREVADIVVLVGRNTSVSIELQVGTVQEMVEVSGVAPVIDTTATMIAHNVTAEELDRLPKTRNFQSVAVFSPSVNTGFVEGGYQINGASAAENNYYIDGVSTNSMIDGSARQSATFDYIQEVQVKTTGLEAEYGGALGGVVSAITKSGGNAFHGDIHYYYYGNKLSAGPTQRLQIDPTVAVPGPYPVKYFQDSKSKNDNHEIGGSLGGPILKDRMWFYTAISPHWQARRVDYQFADGPGSMSRNFSQMNWFSKLSMDLTKRIRMNFSYLYTPQYQTGGLYGYNAYAVDTSTHTLADADKNKKLGYNQPENSVTGQLDFTLTNSSILSVKGGRYYLNYKSTGVDYKTDWSWDTSSVGMAGVPVSLQRPDGYSTPSAAQIDHDLTTRTYVQADYSQFVHFAGQHNLKFGVGTTKNVNNVLNAWTGPEGSVSFDWGSVCQACLNIGGSGGGAYGFYYVDVGGTIGGAGSNITHLYVQDSWKVHPRLTVNAGVRFEKETIPSFRTDIKKYALQFGFGDKVAPRLGAAFDLFGNGKVKISGGWGRFFDWTKFDLPRGTFGGDFWWRYYRSLDNPADILSITSTNMPGTNLWTSDHEDRRLPGFKYLDPNVKPMSSDTIHAGVEWELKKNFVFSGRYVRSKLNRTIEDMGVLINGSEQYFYGNPGEGRNTEGASCYVDGEATCAVPMPKPKRVYDAMELSLSKRFGAGWLFNASYVMSRLWGNYSGLQSTDEVLPSASGYGWTSSNQSGGTIQQRPGTNASRYFDLDQTYFDAHGNEGVFGLLPSDRPHVFKFYGAKQFKFGTEVGGFFRVSSGTPKTTQVWTTQQVDFYPEGRGDLGREPVWSQTDLMVAHELKVGKSETKKVRFEMNMINLFNQKSPLLTYSYYASTIGHYSATGLGLDGVDLRKGFDWKGLLASQAADRGQGVDLDSRFGMTSDFNPGFAARFLVKFIF